MQSEKSMLTKHNQNLVRFKQLQDHEVNPKLSVLTLYQILSNLVFTTKTNYYFNTIVSNKQQDDLCGQVISVVDALLKFTEIEIYEITPRMLECLDLEFTHLSNLAVAARLESADYRFTSKAFLASRLDRDIRIALEAINALFYQARRNVLAIELEQSLEHNEQDSAELKTELKKQIKQLFAISMQKPSPFDSILGIKIRELLKAAARYYTSKGQNIIEELA